MIKTWFTTKPSKGERTGGRQITVPDMALSVKDLLNRYSRGQSLPQTREPIFSDHDYSELQKMDKIDKINLLHQTNNFISETRNKQKETPPQNELTKASAASEALPSAASEQGAS